MQRQPITTELRDDHDDYLELCEMFTRLWEEATSDQQIDAAEIAALNALIHRRAAHRVRIAALIAEADDGVRAAAAFLRIGPHDSSGRNQQRRRDFERLHRPLQMAEYRKRPNRGSGPSAA